MYLSAFKYLALSAALLIVIGTLSVLVFPPERIPITIEADRAFVPVGVLDGLKVIFPRNLFNVFFGSGDFLLPLMVLAFLLGVNMDFDRQLTRPVVQIFDSLSRIFYHLNSLIVELFAIALIAIAAARVSHLSHADLGMYKQIIIILAVDVGVVAFGVFPGALYLLGLKENPYRWLYASIGPAIAGLFSGDHYVSLGFLTKHGKESLGVPRMVGSAVYPLFAVLGRAGTAMVSSVAFILILRSYSSLEITFLQTLWVMLFSFIVSFILGAAPGTGAFFSLFMLCSIYAKGLQEGYLILQKHRAAPGELRRVHRRAQRLVRVPADRAGGKRVDGSGNGELYLGAGGRGRRGRCGRRGCGRGSAGAAAGASAGADAGVDAGAAGAGPSLIAIPRPPANMNWSTKD